MPALQSTVFAHIYIGDEGDDVFEYDAGGGPNAYFGNGGNDTINGSTGNDWIEGGTGNDGEFGGEGSDTYVWNLGDGRDQIADYTESGSPTDIVRFGAGVGPEDVQLSFNTPMSLYLDVSVNGRLVLDIEGQGARESSIEQFVFDDGTIWNMNDVIVPQIGSRYPEEIFAREWGVSQSNLMKGQGGDDTMNGGYGGSDTMLGGSGNDQIIGGSGEYNLLSGGTGNDRIINRATKGVVNGNEGDDEITTYSGHSRIAGGTGSDFIFVNDSNRQDIWFRSGDGNDTVAGFSLVERPKIHLTDYPELHSLADLDVTQEADGSTLIHLSETDSIRLTDYAATDLNENMFYF